MGAPQEALHFVMPSANKNYAEMKIHCKYTQALKVFLTVYDRAVRYRYMITETAEKENENTGPLGKAWHGINGRRFWNIATNPV